MNAQCVSVAIFRKGIGRYPRGNGELGQAFEGLYQEIGLEMLDIVSNNSDTSSKETLARFMRTFKTSWGLLSMRRRPPPQLGWRC